MLILVGIIFLIVEKFYKGELNLSNLKWQGALTIGLCQILALIPGTSRSGITIISGMALGLKRSEAARFSFLMAMPLILGAALSKGVDLMSISLSGREIAMFAIGLFSSALVGYLAVKYLLRFVSQHKLNVFAYYRFTLAALILIYIII
jgi:undecaprenyl-diphosphatase